MSEHKKVGEIKGLKFIGGQITSRIQADEKKNDVSLGNIQVIPPKAIKGGALIKEELYDISYKAEFDEKKLTREGDIVVKLSTPYDAAYVTKEDEGLLITSFCIIVRNDGKEVDSEYLAAFFNSDVYLNQAMNMVSGATMPMLTIGKIKDVEINVLPKDEQEQVAAYYKAITEKEKVFSKVVSLEKEKLNTVLGGEQ